MKWGSYKAIVRTERLNPYEATAQWVGLNLKKLMTLVIDLQNSNTISFNYLCLINDNYY